MARTHWDLGGRTVLVTGAARGIGAESARRLAARGRVALVDLEHDVVTRAAADCPGSAAFVADVTDAGAMQRGRSRGLHRRAAPRGRPPRRGRGLRVLLLDRHADGPRRPRPPNRRPLARRTRGPVWGRIHPVADAAEAVVRGIEGRSRLVVAPPWVKAVLYARGVVQPLFEAAGRRDVPEADRIDQEEHARLGAAASAPVWEGGAAAMAAAPRR